MRHPTLLALTIALLALLQATSAQLTTNNAQSACVELGDCRTAQGTQKTETQNAPVTAPAGTPALAGYTTLDSGFISSLAAAGASAAYTGGARPASAAGGSGASATATSRRSTSAGGSATAAANTASGSSGLAGLGASSGNGAASISTAVMLNSAVLLAGALIGAAVLL